ncbi:MAG TPA: sigma-70 family RNA polymerase sigma factor [Puia sp.]|nr:sigma-70 family RNA polymerase sigma factor [Puia sp.]
MQFAGLISGVNHTTGNNPADKYLVDRVLRGDTRAFGIIVKNTENLVAQIVFKFITVAEDRKDLAQDIYLKAFHNLAGFKFQSKLSTWIARIAYNSCMSWIEKKKLVLPGDLLDEEVVENKSEVLLFQKELSVILRKEMDRLPPIYQTLITLFHHESMSYEELSQITGLPEGTVKSSLFRARKMLKENLLSTYQKETL